MDPMKYVFGFEVLSPAEIVVVKEEGDFCCITYGMVRLTQEYGALPAGTEVFMQLDVGECVYYAFDTPEARADYGKMPVMAMQFPELQITSYSHYRAMTELAAWVQKRAEHQQRRLADLSSPD